MIADGWLCGPRWAAVLPPTIFVHD
jgi:hypothetical protein